jgi:hypothetical protein
MWGLNEIRCGLCWATADIVMATKTVRSGQARAGHGGHYSYTMCATITRVVVGRVETARAG